MNNISVDIEKPDIGRIRSRRLAILAGLHIFQSLALLGFAAYLFFTAGDLPPNFQFALNLLPLAFIEDMASVLLLLILALVGVVIAYALFTRRPWAWLAAMSLQGWGLLAGLIAYIRGNPNYIGMIIGIFLVLYLNRQDIRCAFHAEEDNLPEGIDRVVSNGC